MHIHHQRHTVASLAYQLLQLPITPLKRRLIKQLLPYAITPRKTGGYLLLNREHKPLGFPTQLKAFVDYDAREFDELVIGVPDKAIDQLLTVGAPTGVFHYLYGRGRPSPWESYEACVRYVDLLCTVLSIDSIGEDGAGEIALGVI